jgi:hypothetical protein
MSVVWVISRRKYILFYKKKVILLAPTVIVKILLSKIERGSTTPVEIRLLINVSWAAVLEIWSSDLLLNIVGSFVKY